MDLSGVVVTLVELHEDRPQVDDVLVGACVQRLDVVVVGLVEEQVYSRPVFDLKWVEYISIVKY